ncbi:MAG: hypothetical protein ACRDCY_22175 [Aeromonas veronii]
MSDSERRADLSRQLVKLGDMMGDGQHLEPGGQWIARDYARICRALGYRAPRRNNGRAIDAAMAKALSAATCTNCGGELKQTRKGAKRAACVTCGARFQFGAAKKQGK